VVKKLFLLVLICLASACGQFAPETVLEPVESKVSTTATAPTPLTWWKPAQGLTWQWQLSGTLDTSVNAQVYDVDGQITTTAQVAALKARGIKTIGYADMSYEPGRPDSATLAPYKCGAYQGWNGQFWLDFRQPVVRQVMADRIAVIAAKGFDGLEADSVDAITNNPGCTPALTAADQIDFIKFLATTAHANGLGFGLKNTVDQVAILAPFSDFAVIEECRVYAECAPYAAAFTGKAMFSAEYVSGTGSRFISRANAKAAKICAGQNAIGMSTIIKRLDLDAPRVSCN
jgi:hypothetical protein